MVTPPGFRDGSALPSDRRGQLLLVGAVVIALVVVMLSLVINTVLFTENAGTERVSAQVDGIDEFSFEAGKTARSTMLRVNHEDYDRSADQLQDNVTRSIAGYSDVLARSHATSGTQYVNVSYNTTFHNGSRIVQHDDRTFTEPGTTDPDWDVLPTSDTIGWYLLNVDLRNTTANRTTIAVSNASDSIEYRFNRSDGGDGTNLSVDVDGLGGSISQTANCTATTGRVIVDLYQGAGSDDACSFAGIDDHLEPPYQVTISEGDQLSGRYSIVTETVWDPSPPNTYAPCPTADPVCKTPVVWNGSVDLTYHSSTIQYAQQRNVTVYGGTT